MTSEAHERKVKYEDDNWPKYQKIMEKNGFTLVFKPDVKKGFITPYHNMMLGDGIWLDNTMGQWFRDLKICGKKYGCPVSKNSFNNYPINGIYDFYDPYFTHAVYSISKANVNILYDEGYYNEEKELYRFDFKAIKEMAVTYK